MNQLVAINEKDGVRISSLEIAEVTGKRHADVCRDIRKVCRELEIAECKFASGYLDANNQQRTEYKLDKKMALNLCMSYSAKLRDAVLTRLEELEGDKSQSALSFEEMVSKTLGMAQERIEALECKVAEDAPKVELHNLKVASGTSLTIRDFVKSSKLMLGAKAVKESQVMYLLRRWGWIALTGTKPNAKAVQAGWMIAKAHSFIRSSGKADESITGRITERGQVLALKKLAEYGIKSNEVELV